jgi:hypothetical protein
MKGNFLVKITSIKKGKKGIKIKSKLLMMERKPVKINATKFVQEAATKTQSKMTTEFIKQAENQINKYAR